MSKDYQVAQDIPKDNYIGKVCNEGRVRPYGADAKNQDGGEKNFTGKAGRGPTGTEDNRSGDKYGKKR